MRKEPDNTRSTCRDEADFGGSRREHNDVVHPLGSPSPLPAAAIVPATGTAGSWTALPFGDRTFLFLQGPSGTFFRDLGRAIEAQGTRVLRINFNGGDQHDWPGKATCYRGFQGNWTLFIERFLRDRGVTDLVLFGDCRPMHMAAHQMARLRGIPVHVFEEG